MSSYYPPCGVFSTKYATDQAILKTKFQWFLLIGFLIFMLLFPPLFFRGYMLGLIMICFIFTIAVLGLYFQTGLCGQINIGQGAFMAVGAYACAILIDKVGVNFWVAVPLAGICSSIIGVLFGISATRLKGFYLLIATLAAHFLIIWVLTNWTGLTGGIHGITVPAPAIGGFVFSSNKSLYIPLYIITVLMVFFAKNIGRSRIGRAFIAVRDNDIAANLMGVNVFRYKLLSFMVSSFYAGVAGALYATYMTGVNVDFFTLNMSIWFIAMLIVGGMNSVVGAILGTFFIQMTNELVATIIVPSVVSALPIIGSNLESGMPLIIFALILIVFLIYEPRGISHRWEVFKEYYRLYPFPF